MKLLQPNDLLVYMNILKPELMLLGIRDKYAYENNKKTNKVVGKVIDCLLLSIIDEKGKKIINCPISVNVDNDVKCFESDIQKMCSFRKLLGKWYWDFNKKRYFLSLKGEGFYVKGNEK